MQSKACHGDTCAAHNNTGNDDDLHLQSRVTVKDIGTYIVVLVGVTARTLVTKALALRVLFHTMLLAVIARCLLQVPSSKMN